MKTKLGGDAFNPGKFKFFVLCILEKDALEPRSILKYWGDVRKGGLVVIVVFSEEGLNIVYYQAS